MRNQWRRTASLIALPAVAVSVLALLPASVAADKPSKEPPSVEPAPSHPCPQFQSFKVGLSASSWNASKRAYTAAAGSEGCSVEFEFTPTGATTASKRHAQCDMQIEVKSYRNGLSVRTVPQANCPRGERVVHIKIVNRSEGSQAGSDSGSSRSSGSSGSRIAMAKAIGFDPVWVSMFNQAIRLSWHYTSTDVQSWTWDGRYRHLPNWYGTSITEGDEYSIDLRYVSLWAKIHWEAPDTFKDALFVNMPVDITVYTRVEGHPGGHYSCSFWDSDFQGIELVSGVPIVDLELHRQCWSW